MSGRSPPASTSRRPPSGAARDITLRALDLLRDADVIAAEDTRTARKLMEIHGVPLDGRRLVACHDHSGEGVVAGLVEAIANGRLRGLCVRGGHAPRVGPGLHAGPRRHRAGAPVTAAPGASAVLAALAVAGLPADRFLFAGFLPPTQAARRTAIAELGACPRRSSSTNRPKRVHAC
jgi:16S rRNA (cytidine1402-2'-O)-methyltransferase